VVKQSIDKTPLIKASGRFNRRQDIRSPTIRNGANKKETTKMKKQAYTMIAMIVLFGSMAVVAKAQTGGRSELIANIPFGFNVGNRMMPAGEYTLSRVNPASDLVLHLRSKDGRASVNVPMINVIGKAQESSKLTFHQYGNKYFFAEAWVDGDANGLQTPKSRAERAAESEMAGMKAKAETVALRVR